jgi:hypothetical protein
MGKAFVDSKVRHAGNAHTTAASQKAERERVLPSGPASITGLHGQYDATGLT